MDYNVCLFWLSLVNVLFVFSKDKHFQKALFSEIPPCLDLDCSVIFHCVTANEWQSRFLFIVLKLVLSFRIKDTRRARILLAFPTPKERRVNERHQQYIKLSNKWEMIEETLLFALSAKKILLKTTPASTPLLTRLVFIISTIYQFFVSVLEST